MPRSARITLPGYPYHILNRAVGPTTLFDGPSCYRDFLQLVGESADVTGMRILAYCAMPNHWHMLVWPRLQDDMRRFVHRLTTRHSHRQHTRNGTVGRGPLYQGRYKSFLVQTDEHLLTVCRYVERNPLRANLVASALDWPWSSAQLRARVLRSEAQDGETGPTLVKVEAFPVPLPTNWEQWLDEPQTTAELESLRRHIQSGAPFGREAWVEQMVRRMPVPAGRAQVGTESASLRESVVFSGE